MKDKKTRLIAILAVSAVTASILAGCTTPASETESIAEEKTEVSASSAVSELYFTQQAVRNLPNG